LLLSPMTVQYSAVFTIQPQLIYQSAHLEGF
jgi:hypothetical protein